MADRALRGNRLTKKPKMGTPSPSMTRRPRGEDTLILKKVEGMTPTEALGVMATGGWKGKPHSTKEGRIASGKRKVTRFFHGRKKKGVEV